MCVWEQLLYRLGQDVGGIVPDHVQGLGIVAADQFDLSAAGQGAVEIDQLSIEARQDGALFQTLGNGGGDVARARSFGIFAARAIGEFKIDHNFSHFFGRISGGGS